MNKQQWQAAFGEPDASFDAAVQRTLHQLEEDKKMLKIPMRTLILALAILLALSGVVYAATAGWKIVDYFGGRFSIDLPEDFDTSYTEDYTQELCGLRFHIRDAYMNGDTLIALTEVSRADGRPALFLTDGFDESVPIDNYDQVPSLELWDGRSIEAYAKENGLPMYHVGARFIQEGLSEGSVGDEWAEDDFKYLVFFAEIPGVQSENGRATVAWEVMVLDEKGEWVQKSMEITLSVEPFTVWEVAVNQAVEGLPVVVETVYLQQSRLELQVDVAYHLDEENMPDVAEFDESAAGHYYRFIHLFDPATGERLPEGALLAINFQWVGDMAFRSSAGSVSGEYAGDTIQLRFYDPWLNEYIGAIDVKIR